MKVTSLLLGKLTEVLYAGLVERAWTTGPQDASDSHHSHHLGVPQKYTHSSPTPDLLSQTWTESQYLYFIKSSKHSGDAKV